MPETVADQASAAQRAAFVDGPTDRALETPDLPRTPDGVERAWSAQHREGRVEALGDETLTLYNFDVASAALKREHEEALTRFLGIDKLSGPEVASADRYRITGRASLTGAEQFNLTIAGLRSETVENLMVSRFGVARTQTITSSANPNLQVTTGPGMEEGERYALNRQVQVQKLPVDAPPPPSVRDVEGEATRGESPHASEKPTAEFEFSFRIPLKGTFDLGGWVYVYGTASGSWKLSLSVPAKGSVGPKLSLGRDGPRVQVASRRSSTMTSSSS